MTAAWNYIVIERYSGVTKLFINGTQEGASYTDSNNYPTAPLVIGGRFSATSGDYRSLNGYIDDLRVTKGVARYTGGFTPPTAALPTR